MPPADFDRFAYVLRLALGIGVVYHAICVVLFVVFGVHGLAVYDLIVVGVYALLFVGVSRGLRLSALVTYIVEHNLHAWLATPVFGWSLGFQYLALFGVVGVAIAPGVPRWWRTILYGVSITGFCGVYSYAQAVSPSWSGDATVALVINIVNIAVLVFGIAFSVQFYRELAERAERDLRCEHQRSEELLHNILPVEIAHRLKDGRDAIAEKYSSATVLFADIVGFTALSEELDAPTLVALLNELFSRFDDLAEELGLEKIKTIGDCYMVAAGVPKPRPDHAVVTLTFAEGMVRALREVADQTGHQLSIRIGVDSGPVVAGVIGKTKFVYDLWGDHVNTASRMESHGVPGRVHVSASTYERTRDVFDFEPRGELDIKGKGKMSTYLLVSRREGE